MLFSPFLLNNIIHLAISSSLKNAMKPYSQMVPRTRRERLLAYNKRVQQTPDSSQVLQEWHLKLDNQLVEVEGHRLKNETLLFGQGRTHVVQNGGWDRECGRGLRLYQTGQDLKRWYILFPSMMERDVNRFVNRAIEIGANMGFHINRPRP